MNSQEHAHKSVTILAIALLIFTLFQLTQVLIDGGTLSKNKAQTKENIAKADKALGDDSKMLDQLNAIALGTQKLAEGGNANAKEIIAQLNRAGIKISPPKPGAPGAAGTAPSAAPAGAPPATPPGGPSPNPPKQP